MDIGTSFITRLCACFMLMGSVLFGIQPDANEGFDSLVVNYWNWRLKISPEFASSIGFHGYDDRVEQFTVDSLDNQNTVAVDFLSKLNGIDRSELDATKHTTYDVLKDTLEVFTNGHQWKNYGALNPVNFLEGLWTETESAAPINPKTYDDFFNYLTRIYGWSDQALNYIKRMRQSITHRTTNHLVSVLGAVPKIERLIGNSEIDSPIYKPLNETLDKAGLPDSNKTDLRNAAVLIISSFRTAYRTLIDFIQLEYLNSTRTHYGVNSLPNGTEFYKTCLKWHLSVNITPEEIHSFGRNETDRLYMEMQKIMERQHFNGTVNSYFDTLKRNASFHLNSTRDILKRYENIINDRINSKLANAFHDLPIVPVVVKAMPSDGPVGYYIPSSLDGTTPGVFYVNVLRPDEHPTYGMVSLALHETIPGYHLQANYPQTIKTPDFRKAIDYSKYFAIPYQFPFYTAYTEGWALYAESLGDHDQLNIYQNDYELMGRYSFEILHACRLVVDTGLHHYNWSTAFAIEYILNYTTMSRESATIEVDSCITWPGRACAYKIGELKFQELRKRAQHALGSIFDIRDFHSVVLRNGAVPFNILEQLVEDWIRSVKEDSLDKIMRDFWDWRMINSPEFSTSVAMYNYNDKVNSYSYEKFDREYEAAKKFRQRLSLFGNLNITGAKKISYHVLKNILDVFIAGYKWKDFQPLNPINFLEGWFLGIDFVTASTPFDTQGDFYNYIRRIELVPQQLDEMMNLSRRAIANGYISHNVSVSRIPEQIEPMLTSDPVMSDLYKPFNRSAGKVFKRNQDAFNDADKRMKQAINRFVSKMKEMREFLVNEYMPRTRPGLGIGTLPNGLDNYQACLYFHTSTNITAEQVYKMGEDEVARIAGLMRQKMIKLGFPANTKISQMYQDLNNDPRFLLNTPEETLARFRQIIFGRIQPQIPKYFKYFPNLPLEVRRYDSVGEYMSGTSDGSRPGVFYVNVDKPEYNPTYNMVSFSLHEAIPGHHLAESFGLLADIPEFRKHFEWLSYNAPYFFPFYNSFSEGWALYAEFLGEEMGVYHDDYELLGRYSDEMLRACRLVIDPGIHYYNWSRQQALDYMLNYTTATLDYASSEVDRYVTWPGQATGYKIGELKFKELRRNAQDALGNKFDIAEFHYTILRYSALPLSILEDVVKDWINTQHGQGQAG